MKGAFLNCNTINVKKQDQICKQLANYDFIGLGELNKKWDFNNTNLFQYHTNPDTPRIGFIARNTLDFQYVGIGIKIDDDDRSQIDMYKTVAVSGIYKIRSAGQTVYIEVFYIVPGITIAYLEQLIDHITQQVQRYKCYVAGGDFNKNWLEYNSRKHFTNIWNCNQLVRDYTRVANYTTNGRNRTSKSVIDFILCNKRAENMILQHGVADLSSSQIQGIREFDHYAPWFQLDLPPSKPYIDVVLPNDPSKRPKPTQSQLADIIYEISTIPDQFKHDYNRFFFEISTILDRIIPAPPPNSTFTKRFYSRPLSEEALNMLRIKRVLYKKRNRSTVAKEKFRQVSNKLKKIIENETKERQTAMLRNATTAAEVERTIKKMDNLDNYRFTRKQNEDKKLLIIDGCAKKKLADKVAQFCYKRSAKLVPDNEIIDAGPPLPALYPHETRQMQEDFKWPDFTEIDKFLPKNKRSRSHGPEHISAQILAQIWPAISDTVNNIFIDGELEYPKYYQGYYQFMIPKGNIKVLTNLKQLRPLGRLNPFPKYFLNNVIFKSIRSHLEPILDNRRNFSYRGTHLCIVENFDNILTKIEKKTPCLLVKYDFSNAFGTLFHERVILASREVGLHENVINFIVSYLRNQKWAETIVQDDYGFYLSDQIKMDRGTVQGQIGSDVLFVIQQICLKALDGIDRSSYVDDINDIASDRTPITVSPAPGVSITLKTIDKDKSSKNTVKMALQNEEMLVEQSKKVGFAINAGKTRYIPFNLEDKYLWEQGIKEDKIRRECDLLGFPFTAHSSGLSIEPAAKMIVQRLQLKSRSVHATRNYTNDISVRVQTCRQLIYSCLGELHLVYAFDTEAKTSFKMVQTAVNKVIRATGLSNMTPQVAMDAVLGTTLEDFAKQGIITTGLKHLKLQNTLQTVRNNKFRLDVGPKTYKNQFQKIFNALDENHRIRILNNLHNFDSIKNLLKFLRTIEYDPSIHIEHKWVQF